MFRWLLFRLMFGAGMIKLRGVALQNLGSFWSLSLGADFAKAIRELGGLYDRALRYHASRVAVAVTSNSSALAGETEQRRDRGQQPLIGNAFEPSLVVLSGLLPDSVVHALHFLLVRIGYGFPLLQQGSETLRHSLLRFGDACLQGCPERFVKAIQKGFLLGIDLLPKLDPFLSCGALQLVVVSAKFLPGSALDFINECGGRGIGRFGEKGTGAFERVARHVVHLRLCVVEEAAA